MLHRAAFQRHVHSAVLGTLAAHVGHAGAAVHVAVHQAVVHQQVGVVVGGYVQAQIVVIGVVGIAGVVGKLDAVHIDAVLVAVVVAVGTGKDVGPYRGLCAVRQAVEHHIGAAAHVAADVAAPEDGAYLAALQAHEGGVGHTGQLAAAVEVVNLHVVARHLQVGAQCGRRRHARRVGAGGGENPRQFAAGRLAGRRHVAGVAAAVHGADAARRQRQRGQDVHRRLVVAAEEAAHIVVGAAAHPVAGIVGYGGAVGEDAVAVASVDGAGRRRHRGAVAAGKQGVDHAARDIDGHRRRHHLVAAAVQVADAEVAPEAVEVVVLHAAGRRALLRAGMGAVGARAADVDGHGIRCGTQVAAVVVAAKLGKDGAVRVVYLYHSPFMSRQVGVLGATEERVNDHVIRGHGDVAFLDGGDIGTGEARGHDDRRVGGAPRRHAALELRGRHRRALRQWRVALAADILVVVVAVAAAVHRADADSVCRVGVGGAQRDGRAVVADHAAADVIAAVHGTHRVAAVHRDVGVGGHVGLAAAAEDGAIDGGSGGGGPVHRGQMVGEGDGRIHRLRRAVAIAHGQVQRVDTGGHRRQHGAAHGAALRGGARERQVTLGTVVQPVGVARDVTLRQRLVGAEGLGVVNGAVVVVVGLEGGVASRTPAHVGALPVVQVHARELRHHMVLGVSRLDVHRHAAREVLGGGGSEAAAVGQRVLRRQRGAQRDARQSFVGRSHAGDVLRILRAVDRRVHGAIAGGIDIDGGIAHREVQRRAGSVVAVGRVETAAVGTVDDGLGTLVAVARQRPLVALVEHDPVIGVLPLTVAQVALLDGGTVVPVIPLGGLRQRGAHGHAPQIQSLGR